MKSIHNHIPTAVVPLPNDLIDVIQAYLDKHSPIDDGDSQKLQDELLSIWQKLVQDKTDRYTTFTAILRELRPAIWGSAQWLQWWDTLVMPLMSSVAEGRGLAKETRQLMLDILLFEADEGDSSKVEAAQQTCIILSERILEIWLNQSGVATIEADPVAHYLEQQCRTILLAFGQKRPQVRRLVTKS